MSTTTNTPSDAALIQAIEEQQVRFDQASTAAGDASRQAIIEGLRLISAVAKFHVHDVTTVSFTSSDQGEWLNVQTITGADGEDHDPSLIDAEDYYILDGAAEVITWAAANHSLLDLPGWQVIDAQRGQWLLTVDAFDAHYAATVTA